MILIDWLGVLAGLLIGEEDAADVGDLRNHVVILRNICAFVFEKHSIHQFVAIPVKLFFLCLLLFIHLEIRIGRIVRRSDSINLLCLLLRRFCRHFGNLLLNFFESFRIHICLSSLFLGFGVKDA